MFCRPKLNRRRRLRKFDRARFSLERLENRNLMDASAATLVNDDFEVRQNSSDQLFDVLSNDTFNEDYAGERKITSVSFGSEGGRVEITADGKSIRYAPPADFGRQESFVYYVDNEFSATVTVTVRSPLEPDEYHLTPDQSQYKLSVMSNDPFWNSYTGAKRITSVSTSQQGGEVRIAEDGVSIDYTLPDGTFPTDKFIYIVDDRYPAEVTITIDNPLQLDEFEILQNSSEPPLNVLANDFFWNGYVGARQITLVGPSDNASEITIADQGRTLLYTPEKDFSGFDSFQYIVDGRYEATVHVWVQRPVQDDSVEIDVDSSGQLFDLLSNDYYLDRLHFRRQDVVERITSVTASAQGGVVEVTADGFNVRYSPPAGYEGPDSFEYTADGKYPAKVSVRVTRPVRDDYLQAYEDTINNRFDVRANDFLGNGYQGPRRITSVGESAVGSSVVISDDGQYILYSPKAGFTGQDTFRYRIDGELEAVGWVGVNPLTASDYFEFCPTAGTPYSLPVLSNDHFRENYSGLGLITSVDEAAGVSISIVDAGRSLLFHPENGADARFTYTVDGKYRGEVTARIRSHLAHDQLVVDQNSSSNRLDVLKNDFEYGYGYFNYLCGAYVGPKRITSVGPTTSGGTVNVASDGLSISYSPPPDYHGSDSFTYVVDGMMQSTALVNVIRRVRDDRFHVDPGTTNNVLSVLINDLFAADYRGPRTITNVTSTTAGGLVTISSDQQSVMYTPPANFSGMDSFSYSVDGALKATVHVDGNASIADQFPQFASQDAFQKMLIDDALAAYANLFGTKAYSYWYDAAAVFTSAEGTTVQARAHSDTNVQVAGVDEADLIENDGEYLYSIVDRRLAISRAWPADQLTILSETILEGEAIGMYLLGSRLTVVSREATMLYEGFDALAPYIWRPAPQPRETLVTTYDISDRAVPQLIHKTRFDGTYIESRRIGDFVYVVTNQHNVQLPTPNTQCPDTTPATDPLTFIVDPQCRYETKDEYLNRVNATIGELINQALPHFESFDANGQIVRSGLLNAPEEIFAPIWEGDRTLMSIVSIEMTNDEPGLASTVGAFTSPGAVVYASLDSLYLANARHDQEESKTDLIQFDWDSDTGGIELKAVGSVSGNLLDQFSLDEYDGNLRIATTIHNSGSGNFSGRSENLLFILAEDGGVLEVVGAIENMGLEESIRSVRFMGQRAFVTTFRDRDPLFAVDLSNPTQPRWVGHLTMPGFSSYMQFIDENHILGVGRNTATGFGPTQVALFDVTDLQRPILIDQYTFAHFSTSEAEADHHAFGWFSQHNVLTMLVSRVFWERTDENGDGYRESRKQVEQYELAVFRIDVTPTSRLDQGIQRIGAVAHDRPVRRSAFIDDVLYSVGNDSIKAVDIQDPTVAYGEAAFSNEEAVLSYRFPQVDGSAMQAPILRARQDLAGRLGILPNELLPVSVDHASDDSPVKVVLRNGSRQYLYAAHGDNVELIGDDFQFEEIVNVLQYNADRPVDTNNDGHVAPIDALVVINRLTATGQRLGVRSVVRQIEAVTPDGRASAVFVDVNNDGSLAPIDALIVINHLNTAQAPATQAEGEGAIRSPAIDMNDSQSPSYSNTRTSARSQEATNQDRLLEANSELPFASTTENLSTPNRQNDASPLLDAFAASVDLLLAEDDLLTL